MGVVLKVNTRQSNTGDVIRTVRFFNEFKMNLKYDAIADAFSFAFYFDPNNPEHAEVACVSHYHECSIYYDDELLINGYMLSQGFKASPNPELVQIGGYSKAGVFEDCDIPTNMYPLESTGLSFRQICQKILNNFNTHIRSKENQFKLVIADIAQSEASSAIVKKVDKTIPKSTAKESQNIKSYLTGLATQKNLVLSHTPKGDLLITEANTGGEPLFDYDESIGMVGVTDMFLNFNGQGMHSHITVIMQASQDGGNAGEYTIRNPFVPVAAVFRPKVIILSSGDDITIQEAAENELRKELKSIVLTINLDRGKINGKFIRPNNTCKVKGKSVFLYKSVKWFIESVAFDVNADTEKSVLTCVPTYVYSKETPINFFVDVHENLPRI
jgi:prophage tail gpP-like protein